MRIIESGDIPAGSFIEARDVEPRLGSEELTIFAGTGPSYPWGNAVVTSTVVLCDPDLVAIHLRICHRHGTEQVWRYYRRKAEGWQRITWNRLLTSDRQRVLQAYEQQAPAFAVLPGSLPGQSWTVSMKVGPTYLLARIEGERYYALNNPAVEYVLGTSVSADQTGSAEIRSYPCLACLLIKWRAGTLVHSPDLPRTLALLECRVEGEVQLLGGKVVSSLLCPERVVEIVGEEG